MPAHYSAEEAKTIHDFVRASRRRQREDLARRLAVARRDFDRIAAFVASGYKPRRIYQWGSLLDSRRFSQISDIDLAVEGITDPQTLSALRAEAARLTELPLDIVAMEHIHPAYAEHIRRRGKVVHEA
jgi:predicted nucleotidyltransferase